VCHPPWRIIHKPLLNLPGSVIEEIIHPVAEFFFFDEDAGKDRGFCREVSQTGPFGLS
jgi:hypothetical protein